MTQELSVDGRTTAYRGLIKALAELEKAGDFAAAAHVASAIDVLLPYVEHEMPSRDEGDPSDAVSVLAVRLLEAFGDSAEAVARRQLLSAYGTTLLAWAAIVNRMSALRR